MPFTSKTADGGKTDEFSRTFFLTCVTVKTTCTVTGHTINCTFDENWSLLEEVLFCLFFSFFFRGVVNTQVMRVLEYKKNVNLNITFNRVMKMRCSHFTQLLPDHQYPQRRNLNMQKNYFSRNSVDQVLLYSLLLYLRKAVCTNRPLSTLQCLLMETPMSGGLAFCTTRIMTSHTKTLRCTEVD